MFHIAAWGRIVSTTSSSQSWTALTSSHPWQAQHAYKNLRLKCPGPTKVLGQAVHAGGWTLSSPSEARLEVKKSRFLATAWPVSSPSQALALVKEYSDSAASHNCFAYKIGQEYRSSDDGEPSGTAGRPILAAIEGEQLDGVCVLVTRFFGGIKLGCGGLVRAYSSAARACLKDAPRCALKHMATLEIQVGFASIGSVYQLLERYSADRVSEDFPADTNRAHLQVLVDAEMKAALLSALMDATQGQAVVNEL